VALIVHFVGQLTHPLAILIASIAAFCSISGRGKLITWSTAIGGCLAWLIAGWMSRGNW
jgi:hypothetical protein